MSIMLMRMICVGEGVCAERNLSTSFMISGVELAKGRDSSTKGSNGFPFSHSA